MITRIDDLEHAFIRLQEDEGWQSNLNDTLRNECLNFAHRVLVYVLERNPDNRTEAIENETHAILESFRVLNSLQGKHNVA